MTTSTAVSVHFSPGEVGHRWNPSGSSCSAYGTLEFGVPLNGVKVFVSGTGDIDEIIAELVALRAEMTADTDPPGCICDIASADQCPVHRSEPADEPELTVRERAQRGARKAAERVQAGEGGVLFPAGDEDEAETAGCPCGHAQTSHAFSDDVCAVPECPCPGYRSTASVTA